jgi:hypothetical protein
VYRDAGEVEATAAEPERWGQAVTEGVRDLGGRVAEEVDAAQDDRAGSWPSEREGAAAEADAGQACGILVPAAPARRIAVCIERQAPVLRAEGPAGAADLPPRSSSSVTMLTPSPCWPMSSPPAVCGPSTPAPSSGHASWRRWAFCSSLSPLAKGIPGQVASAS